MTTREKIENLYEIKREYSVDEIHELLSVSRQMIHRVVKKMVTEEKLRRVGEPPKTVYQKVEQKSKQTKLFDELDNDEKAFLQENFVVITELGEYLKGAEAFLYWCDKRNQRFKQTVKGFIQTTKKYRAYFTEEQLIDGTAKLQTTKGIDKVWLDKLYYFDFYAIERFGKTKLGTLLHFAKQTQSEYLMELLVDEIAPRVSDLLASNLFDAVGFVAPTVKRQHQLMTFVEKKLQIDLPRIDIRKLDNRIPIPQKSLNKLDERIKNAKFSFQVNSSKNYQHILLIDDAVGSGTTLNEIAGKIKFQKVGKQVTGLAIVGSFKGFDVVTDV